jgi:hypothetical protein
MSKLNFKKQPTQEEIENFIDLIEYNRSQRNKDKDLLMKQFECGNVTVENGVITLLPFDQFCGVDFDFLDKAEYKHTQDIIKNLTGVPTTK